MRSFPPLSLHQGPLGGSPPAPILGQPLAPFCPLSPSFLAREKRHVEAAPWMQLLGAQREELQKHTGTGPGRSYLCYRLLIPHGCLFDEVVDCYIPISTRNDHPGPPETYRHFHFSAAALIPMRKKPRQNDKNHPRCAKVKNSFPVVVKNLEVKWSSFPASSEDNREAPH